MSSHQEVEFKTIDGITLRGRVYAADGKGPGIVMSPGFNGVKEMVGLPSVAQAFQQAGITVLVYDPRSTGLSDGEPRNDIDPFKQIEDYSDALSFLSSHPMVDSSRLALWGISLSGAVALSAASFDKRARVVIAVCPAMLNDKGENPAGFNLGIDKNVALRILGAQDESISTRATLAPNHVNRTTIQSYYKLLMWNPSYMWKHLHSTPAMFIVPELDQLVPAEVQQKHFELLSGPKEMHVQGGCGHLDILEGDHLPELMKLQIEFIEQAFGGELK